MTEQTLSRNDLTQLGRALAHLPHKKFPNVEVLDGFLSAVICGPADVSSAEFVRGIIGPIDLFEDGKFAVPPYLRDLIFVASRLRDDRVRALRSGRVIVPLLVPNVLGVCPGNDWARAFLRQVELLDGQWAPLMNDVELRGCLAPIFALAYEHDPDPNLRLFAGPLNDEHRRKLIGCIGSSLLTAYRFFNKQNVFQIGSNAMNEGCHAHHHDAGPSVQSVNEIGSRLRPLRWRTYGRFSR